MLYTILGSTWLMKWSPHENNKHITDKYIIESKRCILYSSLPNSWSPYRNIRIGIAASSIWPFQKLSVKLFQIIYKCHYINLWSFWPYSSLWCPSLISRIAQNHNFSKVLLLLFKETLYGPSINNTLYFCNLDFTYILHI